MELKTKKWTLISLLVFSVLILGTRTARSEKVMGALETATFGGGCFWCTEHAFDEVTGVISTTSGYTDGHTENPSYREVSSGETGHVEVVQVVFDPNKVSYETLLDVFWRNIDPTVKDQQFCDHGDQYRSAIFYHSEQQKELAWTSKEQLEKEKPFNDPIFTEVTKASTFYPAEEYHQDFHHKNPIRYKVYRFSCGRDQRLKVLWGAEK